MEKKKLKIMAVCGMGLGSSLVLKMSIEKAVKELNLEAEVITTDITTAKGAGSDVDIVITSNELAQQLEGIKPKIAVVKNYVNVQEIKEAINKALNT
ncbi:PTS sugar transporter subunit IIB [Caldanaerobacter sp.]|uniref:PTS sugar transporter subunit IIB n=1 Tax=Caldanaerobacter sp. TaxID=2930036 RepID=UPI003C70F2B0